MITIVDYQMGNLLSIHNMLKKIGFATQITSDPDKVAQANKLILPGVGAFSSAMKNIQQLHLTEALDYAVIERGTPILGICLGMQLMCRYSEEGNAKGLGWLDAEVKKIPNSDTTGKKIKIPHIGWNKVFGENDNYLLSNQENRFYFVHSYYVELNRVENLLFQSNYGIDFCSAFKKDNIIGVQFHPEKSHKFGLNLLKKFGNE